MKYIIERPKMELCETYFDTAQMIDKLPKDENFIQEAAKLIKLFGHHEKLSVYSHMLHWKTEFSKFMNEYFELKIQTHQDIINDWNSGKYWPVWSKK